MYDYLIVGAGLSGAIFAHEATKRGKKVKVIDKRDHIGGNIYCEEVEGINVHKYGAHIFHTSNKKVWDYVNQFAEFNNYINSPVANYKGSLYNLPFNMNTFYQLWDQKGPVAVASVAVHFKGTVFQHPAHLVPFRKFSSGSLPCRLPRPVHAALPASLLRKLLWGRSPNWSRLRKLSVSAVADDGGHSPHIRRFYPEKALQS